jgi:hypothetical protein
VAFGFFNIETHMLLLEQLFFFADRFCDAAVALVTESRADVELEAWRIEDRGRVGNLHGAIAGLDLSGFIGATYEAWPFPRRPEGFRQAPDGHRNEAQVRAMIDRLGTPESIALAEDHGAVSVGEYRFSRAGFAQLLAYVVRGGYPRWRDDSPPDYVRQMIEALAERGVTIAADAEL